METFLASKYSRHETEIARLKDIRLVTAQETSQNRGWDEAKIKNLTGGDTLSGRFMRQDFFDFPPTHKLTFAGNYKPSLRNVDEAMRRRFLLVPFTVTIPKKERDRQLATEKLKKEWPAILRWMIDGAVAWHQNGLIVPNVVIDTTTEYLGDQDVFSEWLEDRIIIGGEYETSSSALFGSWKQWCEQHNEFIGTQKAFVERIKNHSELASVEHFRDETMRGFRGIRLKNVSDMKI